MEESNSPDHLGSSLTDLMTSLMVIFILLLLVFVQRTGAKDPAVASKLLEELQRQLKPGAIGNPEIKIDPKEPNKILIVAPERLMSFQPSKYELSGDGRRFLQEKLPAIATVLYDRRFRDDIESIVVEGHSDLHVWEGSSNDESRNKNLELSQKRAMEVVKTALDDLKAGSADEQGWFIGELSASGRGQQDCSVSADQADCRKVRFVIRVKAADAKAIEARMK